MIDTPISSSSSTELPRRRSGRPDKPIPRSELLRVARELYAARGYAGVSMADVAHKAGLQKSSLFHHFPTKDQLYKEVLDGVLQEVGDAVKASLVDESGSWLERLDASAIATARILGGDSSRARLILREMLNDEGERSHVDGVLKMLDLTVAFLEKGAAAGAWPQQDFKQLTLTIAGIHSYYFAVPGITKTVSGHDPFDAGAVDRRVAAVRDQVRRLLGVAPLQQA
ncbi:MAG TPA: TetR/AcrR family transcriptional regulator [Myxococcota bacterium]